MEERPPTEISKNGANEGKARHPSLRGRSEVQVARVSLGQEESFCTRLAHGHRGQGHGEALRQDAERVLRLGDKALELLRCLAPGDRNHIKVYAEALEANVSCDLRDFRQVVPGQETVGDVAGSQPVRAEPYRQALACTLDEVRITSQRKEAADRGISCSGAREQRHQEQ